MQITKHWINKEKRRYYSLFIQQDLLGDWILERANGGLGNKFGAFKTKWFANYEAAKLEFDKKNKLRKQHGYKLINNQV